MGGADRAAVGRRVDPPSAEVQPASVQPADHLAAAAQGRGRVEGWW